MMDTGPRTTVGSSLWRDEDDKFNVASSSSFALVVLFLSWVY